MRNLIPRVSIGGWWGSSIKGPDAEGGYLAIQWLGFMVEIAVARVSRGHPEMVEF